jgi:hypothetical protein
LRGFEVEVVEGGGALELRGFAEGAAGQLDVRVDGIEHGIERLAAHRRVKERRIEEMGLAAFLIEAEPCAGCH